MEEKQIIVLGHQYQQIEDVKELQKELIYFSYRFGFSHQFQNHMTSDSGWGCMLRSGQMIFANGLLRHMKEHPEFQKQNELKSINDIRIYVIRQFLDLQQQPLSIQQISAVALEEFELHMGFWYSPNRIAYSLKKLMNNSPVFQNIQLTSEVMYSDRPLYFSSCVAAMTGEKIDLSLPQNVLVDVNKKYEKQQSLILQIVCQIGIDSPEEQYLNIILKLFTHKYSIGMIGGKHSSGYYFTGLNNEKLIFLDPHITQDIDKSVNDIKLQTYSQQEIKTINKHALGPSVGLGFYFKGLTELNEFWNFLLELQKNQSEDFFLMIEKEQNTEFKERDLIEDEDFIEVD